VDVVRHQDVSVHATSGTQCAIGEAAEIAAIVILGQEARLPVVPALDDMLGHGREIKPGASWHVRRLRRNRAFRRPEKHRLQHESPEGKPGSDTLFVAYSAKVREKRV
jgi:hypothetical protein